MFNGKIYKITSKNTTDVYYGSTCKSLNSRFKKHKSCMKSYGKGNSHFVTSFKIIKFPDAEIKLVENFECDNLEMLRRQEGKYILGDPNSVNKCVAGRTKKEYKRFYFLKNRQKIYDYLRSKKTCGICNSIVSIRNFGRHQKSAKCLSCINPI